MNMLPKQAVFLLISLLGVSASTIVSAAIPPVKIRFDAEACAFCQGAVSSIEEGVKELNKLVTRGRIPTTGSAPFLGFQFDEITFRGEHRFGLETLINYKYWPGPTEFLDPLGYRTFGVFPTPIEACKESAAQQTGRTFLRIEFPNPIHPDLYGCILLDASGLEVPTLVGTECNQLYVAAPGNPDQCIAIISGFISVIGQFPEENFGSCDGAAPPPVTGNPVHMVTGNKYEVESDYVGASRFPLRFERHYNSQLGRHEEFSLGDKWRHTYNRRATSIPIAPTGTPNTVLIRPDGREHFFVLSGSNWVLEESVALGVLKTTAAGTLEFTNSKGDVEAYDAAGLLVSITNRLGLTQTLSYDSEDRLLEVVDDAGRTLSFSYNTEDRISELTDPAGNIYRYDYDAVGNLISVTYPDETPADDLDNPVRAYVYENVDFVHSLTGIIDENGTRSATWNYDASNRAILSEHAGGADRTTLVYNVDGTTTVTDALSTVRDYEFDAVSGAYRINNVIGGPCTACGSSGEFYTYDLNGFLASLTDHNGNRTDFTHDAHGRELSRTEAVGTVEQRTVTTQWLPDFRLPVLITETGKTTAFTYDSQGRLLTRTETDTATSNTRTVTSTYNAQGLLATIDGPRTDVTDVTAFTYDAQGNLTDVTNALGHISGVTAYDSHGRPLTLDEPNGLVTTLIYDARSRLLSRDVGGQLTTFEYDGTGNVTKTTLSDGSFLVSEYDNVQRLVAIEDNLGNRTEFTLDAAGNRVGETVRDATSTITRTRSRVYDALNHLIQDIGGAGQQTDFEYDLQGNQTAFVDGNLKRTESNYNALNRLVKLIDPQLGETDFSYDARDNLVSVTDAGGLATTYSYDGLENRTAQLSPDTGVTQFTHDDAGNRLSQIDARGVVTDFSYDALNRLVAIDYLDTSKSVSFEYDQGLGGIGQLTRMIDGSGSTDFVYDIRGNLLSETRTIDGVAYVTAYTYDSANRPLTITYPSGTVVTYTRDVLGRIDSVSVTTSAGTQTLASNIGYLPFGPIEGLGYGNGDFLSRLFDQDYRLTNQTAGSVQDVTLGYDPANSITSIVDALDSTRSQNFIYDGLNRLTQGQGIFGTEDYSYDSIGNRTTLTSAAGIDTYNYGAASHRLNAITGPNATSFTFDANGNTITSGPFSFTYDDTNRMTEALASGILVGEYVYNGKGERVKKTAGGVTTVFHYDAQGLLIAESDTLGNTQREYVYLNGEPLALITSGGPTGVFTYINNHLGTPQYLTDGSGAVVWAADYEPFGNVLETVASVENNLRFPGQYFDKETGLHYNFFRDYNPSIGRYVQSDPIGLGGGINTFVYVGANPLRYKDTFGLEGLVRGMGVDAPGGRLSVFLAATFASVNFTYNFRDGFSLEQLLVPEIGTSFGFCEEPISAPDSSDCGSENQSSNSRQEPKGNVNILLKNFGITILGTGGQCLSVGLGLSAFPFANFGVPVPDLGTPEGNFFAGG